MPVELNLAGLLQVEHAIRDVAPMTGSSSTTTQQG